MKALIDMTLEELWQLFPIILKEHNPNYKIWYHDEKQNLLDILHRNNVSRINHIGSTSVEGLISKPTIDILLELPKDYDIDSVTDSLKDNGWILMARNNTDKILNLNKGYTPKGFAEKVFHLHIKPFGDWGELYFRDYLQNSPKVAKQYEELKLSLKRKFEHDRDAYTNEKSDFVLKYTQIAQKKFNGKYVPN